MGNVLPEIRMNEYYTQYVSSDFEKGEAQPSTPLVRHKVKSTGDFIKKLSGFMSATAGNSVLPSNCRYIEHCKGGKIVVIEEPPAYRTIRVDMNFQYELKLLENDNKIEEWGIDKEYYSNLSNRPFKFTLAIPYTIFILSFDNYNTLRGMQVFFRVSRLSGPSDYLMKAPLTNINSSQFVCTGTSIKGETLNRSVENAIMSFWASVFNDDYTYNYRDYAETAGVNTYIGWQALSQKDPMFIYSVGWIKSQKSLNEAILHVKDNSGIVDREYASLNYNTLRQMFSLPVASDKEEEVSKKSKKRETLFYDIVQDLYYSDTEQINAGDSLKWGKRTAYIDSFIGFSTTSEVKRVRLQFEDFSTITIKFTKKVKSYIIKVLKGTRFSEKGILKNGKEIKEGSFVITKDRSGRTYYRKVHFIRKSVDGSTEAKLGNSYYILENLDADVVDLSKPKINDIELNKTDNYLIVTKTGPIFNFGGISKFIDCDVTSNGKLYFNFEGTVPKIHKDNQRDIVTDGEARIYKNDEIIPLPQLYRIGRELKIPEQNDLYDKENYPTTYATKDGIVRTHRIRYKSPTINEIKKYLFSEDLTKMTVHSYGSVLEFKVGDRVVVADWKNPINMLMVKTITAFTFSSEEHKVNFVLQDKNGTLSNVEYINNGIIYVGRIRQITNAYKGVTAGTKIIAEKGYISNFPKKDVNIIIGFITDTGIDDALVLCSNCCTLWFSEMMEDFKRVTMKSKKWATLQHAPIDISKIKLQPGDICMGDTDYITRGGWLVIRQSLSTKSLKITELKGENYMESYYMDNYAKSRMVLDCIPNPRISGAAQNKSEVKRGFPTLHGSFFEMPNSPYGFLTEERSFINAI